MVNVGLVVRLEAKQGKEEELASFLAEVLPLAQDEAGMPVWLAMRTDSSTFCLVDAFTGEDERQAHFNGDLASTVLARADELLASAPSIEQTQVLAAKH